MLCIKKTYNIIQLFLVLIILPTIYLLKKHTHSYQFCIDSRTVYELDVVVNSFDTLGAGNVVAEVCSFRL